MNQIMLNIKNRRSRREFLKKEVDEGIIEEIIEAGRYAPSALNRQPWKFIVITNKGVIRELSQVVKGKVRKIIKFLPVLKPFKAALRDPQIIGAIKKTISTNTDTVFHDAPLLILIASDKKSGPHVSKDCALASQNMMLYAYSVGVSSCFIGRADILMTSEAAKEMVDLPREHTIQCAIVFGYSPERKPLVPDRKRNNIINRIR